MTHLGIVEKDACCDTHGAYRSAAVTVTYDEHVRTLRWSDCPTCNAQAEHLRWEAQQQREQVEAQLRLERRLQRSGIPQRFQDRSFENFIVSSEAQGKARAKAQAYAEQFESHAQHGTALIFCGPPGTGKSHLACAIARAVLPKHTVLYTSAIDAIRMLRDTWRRDAVRSETQLLDELTSLGLLILDEVGMQYGTEAEQVSLFDIIDKRYRDKKPMILLTNVNSDKLNTIVGERSMDRLREQAHWVAFNWDSYRGRGTSRKPILTGNTADMSDDCSTAQSQ